MRDLLIASRNKGKIKEIREILANEYQVLSPDDVGIDDGFDVDETGETFTDNARLKAGGFAKKSGLWALADDSGLEVDALDGRPGVYSKRYASTDEQRCKRLLCELEGVEKEKRTARFVCVVSVWDPEKETVAFESKGAAEGKIGFEARGENGFGYDPVFVPDEGDGRTFAELGVEFKNKVSHRARALRQIQEKIKP